MGLLIRPETFADRNEIREVLKRAFGGDAEARLVNDLRAGQFVRVALVAEIGARVVGHVLFSDLPIVTSTTTVTALALAPLAVLPEYQNRGVGSALVRRGLDLCRDAGHRIVLVLGHPRYYPRFGFRPELAANLESPFSGRPPFMAAELVPGALVSVHGRVQYPPPFAAFS